MASEEGDLVAACGLRPPCQQPAGTPNPPTPQGSKARSPCALGATALLLPVGFVAPSVEVGLEVCGWKEGLRLTGPTGPYCLWWLFGAQSVPQDGHRQIGGPPAEWD